VVAQLGAGTSVGEMAYLAPSPELRKHATDVRVTEVCTSVSFTPQLIGSLSGECQHRFRSRLHQGAGAPPARRARTAGPSAAYSLKRAAAAGTQQDKMKTCNADAKTKDLKGDERKAFMKDCLSK
jgi:hypothetical protein